MATNNQSPAVQVSISDQSQYVVNGASTIPLFVIATRTDKTLPDGTGTAAGTAEAGVLRQVGSQRDTLQSLGNPVFVTSAGVPIHGHETNEYGLHGLWSFMQFYNRAYYVRADIDLGQLVATTTEPLGAPADGTYWIQSDDLVPGIFRRNDADTAWEAVPTSVYTTTPGSSDGVPGDWAFDFSTTDITLKFKIDIDGATPSSWKAIGAADFTSTDIDGRNSTNNVLWHSATAPTGAGANDYWFKTASGSAGLNFKLVKYRASDASWVPVTVITGDTAPSDTSSLTVWHDTSTVATNGKHPIKVGNGSSFSALTYIVQSTAPYTDPEDGTLWIDTTLTDFAMYVEDTNVWVPITTTTSASPTNIQKVISASAPISPATGSIWIDTSGSNFDNFPVVKRYTGAAYEDITNSVSITDTYTAASLVTDGSYWINTGDPITRNTVKKYNSSYEPTVLDEDGIVLTYDEETMGHWEPFTGAIFGRKSQRYAVTRALKAAINDNDDIRSESIKYDTVLVPGYPELYSDMLSLQTEIGICFGIADTPSRMIPSGVPTGTEVTATDWKNNTGLADSTGEEGFTGSGSAFMAHYYPWGLTSNVDGNSVMIPPSTIAMRTIAYSDAIGYPWFAPMGEEAGLVNNADSVGYLNDAGDYKVLNFKKGHRDILYGLNINPITNLSNVGLRVWGQKTTYGSATALDRINVARLILKIRYDLQTSLRSFIGKPDDPITWASAKNQVTRYLAGIKSLRGLVDFAVRCDENNNTAARLDNNEMWVDVALKPVKAVEFIYVPITIVDQGASLTQ